MPGARTCGRCSSALGLATALIDVQPPRATRFAKGVRTLTGSRRTASRVCDAWAVRREEFRQYTDTIPPARVLWRCVVPGWPQWAVGQRWQGHVFVWSYLALVGVGLALMGSSSSGIWLGLAFSVHSWSVVDVINQTFTDRSLGKQLARSIGVSLLLGVCVYWPAGAALGEFAAPYTMNYSGGGLNAGDVLLGNALAGVQPGRVVMYEIPRTEYSGRMREGGRYMVYEGFRIDRVLAGPGDQVVCHAGAMTVNGQPSPWRPLDESFLPPDLSFTVPDGKVFILPSTTANMLGGSSPALLQQASLVDIERVQTVIYARTHPLGRFRWF